MEPVVIVMIKRFSAHGECQSRENNVAQLSAVPEWRQHELSLA